jgi:lipopolysaccharide biosynthesis glycosyltransferase
MSNNCIVLSTNKKFLWTAFVTIDSFLKCNQNKQYDIYILCTSNEIHQEDKNTMLSSLSVKYNNFSLYFHDMKPEISSITKDQLDAIKTTIR